MVDTGTTSTATLCDSCKTTPSTIYCNAESTFLCANCDTTIHRLAANRHPRVLVCEVCEEVPAVVMCKADDAALCATCDYDVHSANNLAHRHERIPIVPLSHVADTNSSQEEKEAEAATWLLPDPNNNNNKLKDESGSPRYYPCDDIVVPEQNNNNKNEYGSGQHPDHVVDVVCLGSKPMMICSPTVLMDNVLERNIVRDDMKNKGLSGFEREERVLRYREKRKYRKFIKTIRYTSRKAYAEIRPRINGRFAKRFKADCIDSLGATRDSSED